MAFNWKKINGGDFVSSVNIADSSTAAVKLKPNADWAGGLTKR